MIIVEAKGKRFRIHWTGKDWRDESGGIWKQHDYGDFSSVRYGNGVVITEDPFRPPIKRNQAIIYEIRSNFNKKL